MMQAPSYNTALMHRRVRSSFTGDAFGKEDNSCDNPTRLSLRPVPHALHLSLSGSLMQERYVKSTKFKTEG